MKIEILCSGCSKCKKTEKIVKKVIEETGKEVEVRKIEDMDEIIDRGVMMTPALVVDGEVKISGCVPSKNEIRKIIK